MQRLRHVCRFFVDLGMYSYRSGQWWLPLALLVLAAAALTAATAKVVVPTMTYTLI